MIETGVPEYQAARVAPILEKLRAELAAAMAALLPDPEMAVDLELAQGPERDEE